MADGQIFNIVVAFFEEDNWNFQWLEDMPVLSIPFTGKNGRWMCYAQSREEQEQFVFYSVSPINVPPERRAAIAEFITRANYGMIVGNFEMDYGDGEVRYKTSIDVEGDTLTSALIKQLVYANVIIMDRYLPGMMAVIYGDTQPATEIEKIEGDKKKSSGGKLEEGEDSPFDNLSETVRSRIEDILRNIEEKHSNENTIEPDLLGSNLYDDDLYDDLFDDDDEDDLFDDDEDLLDDDVDSIFLADFNADVSASSDSPEQKMTGMDIDNPDATADDYQDSESAAPPGPNSPPE